MFSRSVVAAMLVVCLLLLGSSAAWPQTSPLVPTPLALDLEGPVRPDTIAARKAAVQARLEALGQQVDLPQADVEATRATLEQSLTVLTALEQTWQQRAAYLTQIEEIPSRVQELTRTRQTLEAQPAADFPTVTEELRSQYETRLQAVQAEIQELRKQTAASEVRLAAVAREIEQRATARAQLDKDLLAVRSKTGGPTRPLEVTLLSLKRQLLQAEVETLQAESEWLTKRAPWHDALLSLAQTRLQRLQAELDTIKQALGTTLQQEQATLHSQAVRLEQKLEQTADPVEALRLAVHLETVDIRKSTAGLRQQLNRLSDEVLAQEQRNAQLQQDRDRLVSLVEKYTGGEGVAQRLLGAFERLQRERQRDHDTPVKALEARLRALTPQMLALDDRLYDFDRQAETRLAEATAALQTAPPAQQEAGLAAVRTALDAQKAALREQQQALTELTQSLTRLLLLHREYKHLLHDSYRFILTNMFWLRTAEPLGWTVGRDMVKGVIVTSKRLQAFVRAEPARLQASFSDALPLWSFVLLVLLGLPWVAYRLHKHLRSQVVAVLAACEQRQVPPGVGAALLLVASAALWPAYLALLAWMYGQFLPEHTTEATLGAALLSGLQVSAVVLWIGLVGRAILQPEGWGQRFWELSPALCQFLRRIVTVGCLAALGLLVPHHVLLTAPGGTATATSSLALARFLFLTFQVVLLVLVAIVGWRGSPLMTTVLARSRQEQGLLWRLWPLVYAVLLSGGVATITLHVLGYLYAARYIWSRVLESLLVVLVLQWLLRPLGGRVLRRGVGTVFRTASRMLQRQTEEQAADRVLTMMRRTWNVLLALLSLGIILEIWGVSVTWLLTLPSTLQLLRRAVLIGLALGLVLGVIQASNALTEYLLRPRTDSVGGTREAGRKLRTLAPLIQTIIRVGVMFIAVLLILEQLGVATGPILAGVGIFGLAVGFASQSLIKDVINGLFILFEDSLSVGDIVMLRGTGGQVEKVTLRAVTIRDLAGNVHVIPNSTIDMVTNMTKEFSRYVLDVGVAYREDVDTVIRILQEIDAELRQDPAYAKDILEPLEIMGLDRFAESAVIVRARLKTRPIQQWRIGREFNRRLKKVFDERGIEIPFPHRTLYWGRPKDGAQPPLQVAMEAGNSTQKEG